MIIGIGSDIVEIARIERALLRHSGRFEEKCFTPYEQTMGSNKEDAKRASYFAKRFAAKEACAKAMGHVFVGDFALKDIGVEEEKSGRPYIVLAEPAANILQGLVPDGHKPRVHLTISDERDFAIAFVVIEAILL